MRCRKIQCVYGSVTGKSQSIAEQIYNELVSKKFEVDLYSFEEFGKSWSLEELDTLIIVSSTTGDGEQPEAITKFWRKLRPKALANDFLAHVNFTILGLGDTNYNQFCNAPKKLRNRLKELGCVEIYAPGWADDGIGLEIVVEPWLNGLYPSITTLIKGVGPQTEIAIDNSEYRQQEIQSVKTNTTLIMADNNSLNTQLDNLKLEEQIQSLNYSSKLAGLSLDLPSCPARYLDIVYLGKALSKESLTQHQNSSKLPFAVGNVATAQVISNTCLTSKDAVKTYMDMKLATPEPWNYQPGDSFGVCCLNDDQDVSRLISQLKLESVIDQNYSLEILQDTKKARAKVPDYLPAEGTVRGLLKSCLDLRAVPKKLFIRALVEYTTVAKEKRRLEELCSKQGALEYMSLIREGSISTLDLLSAFPSCVPPLSLLTEHLTRLLPRPYSISTSPAPSDTASQLGFVYTVVDTPKPGLCTTWLRSLQPGDQVQVYQRAPTEFRVPLAADARYIMVCAGSGIGPFLGFLEHRKNFDIKSGFAWLVFGCRNKGKDDLHVDLLNSYLQEGYLSKLSIVYSRDQSTDGTKYVQDVLDNNSKEVLEMITNEAASVFVCGDAKNMGKCVYDTFINMLSADGKNGGEFMKDLVAVKRYKQDLWN